MRQTLGKSCTDILGDLYITANLGPVCICYVVVAGTCSPTGKDEIRALRLKISIEYAPLTKKYTALIHLLRSKMFNI